MKKYYLSIAMFLATVSTQAQEAGTFEPDSIFYVLASLEQQNPEIETFRTKLEKFCRIYYRKGFADKIYKEESLMITRMGDDPNIRTLFFEGTHSYYGKSYGFGRKLHVSVPFKASINNVMDGVRIVFRKWYEPDIDHPDGGWETIERIVSRDF